MKQSLLVLAFGLMAAVAAAQPTIDPATVHVVASPNVLTWPVTTRIQRLEIADAGVRVTFDRCQVWPNVTPPGWAGPLRFTLWLFENIGGEWYASGIIQFWACDQASGGAIFADDQIARNWVYDNRWSAMVRHQPAPGERIGFMVSAGNARGQDDHLVAERSDIVEIAMPSGPAAPSFLAMEGFLAPPIAAPPIVVTTPAPPAVVVPPVPPPAPQPLPSTQTCDSVALEIAIANLRSAVDAGRAENQQFYADARSKFASVATFVTKYILPELATWFVAHR